MDVAKQYAMRNREGSSWFSHDVNKNIDSAAPAVPQLDTIDESNNLSSKSTVSSVAAETSVIKEIPKVEHSVASPLSEPKEKSQPTVATPPRQSIEQSETPSSTPSKAESTPSTPGRSQLIKPTCNSNQWYKFSENGSGSRLRQQTTGKKTRPVSQPVDWFSHDGKHKADAKTESKLRVTDQEGASYCRRDKMGSTNAWFGHNAGGDGATITPRVTSQEGASNATRMRGESENWFNHSANSGSAREPIHVSKGRTANRPQGNEMHSIFHHGN